jgi:hypothetical protein
VSRIYYDDPKRDGADDDAHWEAKRAGVVGPGCRLTGSVITRLQTQNASNACAACTVSDAMREECGGRPMEIDNDRKKAVDAVRKAAKVDSTTTADENQLFIEGLINGLKKAFRKQG